MLKFLACLLCVSMCDDYRLQEYKANARFYARVRTPLVRQIDPYR